MGSQILLAGTCCSMCASRPLSDLVCAYVLCRFPTGKWCTRWSSNLSHSSTIAEILYHHGLLRWLMRRNFLHPWYKPSAIQYEREIVIRRSVISLLSPLLGMQTSLSSWGVGSFQPELQQVKAEKWISPQPTLQLDLVPSVRQAAGT